MEYDLLVEFLKEQEGYSALPYTAPEGNKTIGYGHVIFDLNRVDKELADKLLELDIWMAERRAKFYVDSTFAPGTWNELPLKHQQALTELTFNVGSLSKFPKFTHALVHGNIDKAIRESKRYYRGRDGKWVELRRRNIAFVDTFLKQEKINGKEERKE